MTRFDTEQEFIEYFDRRYEIALDPLMLDIEEEVQGSRAGTASWTTRDQLQRMTRELGLSRGSLLLDVGCGTGWAGVEVARATGARVVLTDLPYGAVRLARDAAEALSGLASAADVTQLPFRDDTFDAIVHSDVLCCLFGKQDAITEMHRVLKPTGTMVFTVILIDEPISFDEALERLEDLYQFVASERSYAQMLTGSGFTHAAEDWTTEFRDMADRLAVARDRRLDELVALLGEDEAVSQASRARWNVGAVDEGLLKRRLYVASPV